MGGLLSGRIGLSNSIIKKDLRTKSKKVGVVYDVILDDTHPYSINNEIGSLFVGSIFFRTIDNLISSEDELPIAHPIDKNFKSLPVKNEIVEIYDLVDGIYAYRRLTIDINPSVTNNGDIIKTSFTPIKEIESTITDYKTTSITGITNTNFDNTSKFDGFGKYYIPQLGLHKLKLYEGDTVIESRFGQSIRFSAFNNIKNEFSPTLILRNSESAKNRKENEIISIEEDINRDGGIIAMTSNQYQLPFQPGTVDDGGTSDFETRPESFQNYPSKLIGDQILINSGRLIFSAKNAEMIFYSKKNYGFISDGALSIDNKLGIDVSVNDNINVVTNSRDVVFYTDNGSIFLGNKDLEPIVKGQQLVEILSELIDAISRQVFRTPSGPSAEGPNNISEFATIKSKLNNILSKLNQTA
jgi:hypothetical protein